MFKNMKIKTRVAGGFLVMIVMLLFCNAISVMLVNSTAEMKDEIIDTYHESGEELQSAYAHYEELKYLVRNMMYVHEDDAAACLEDISSISDTFTELQSHAAKFEGLADLDDADIKEKYDTVSSGIEEYAAYVKSCVQLVQNGDFDSAKKALTGEIIAQAKALDGEIDEMIELLDEKAEKADEKNQKALDAQIMFVTIVGVAVSIIGIIILITITTAINKPVDMILKAFKKISMGEIDVDLNKIRNDEFGEMIDAMNKAVETTKEHTYIATEIASGNLTVKVTPKGSGDVLGNALAKLVEDDNAVLTNIRESTEQVTTGSEQVASASQSLAQGSTEQASAIEEITASISDIAERTRKNAEQANQANDLVVSAKNEAEQGNVQMKDMISAMAEINESSENISKIIKVIDDIAFQTNILALNAAVEAARAGSHGKGFAVVAEEVRNLAGKSASAASETAEMIEDSIRRVEHGSALATETAQALEEIVNAVEQIVGIISDIASASNEQATAVAQIDQAINQVSQVVQTNSATSEECAAASEELSNQSARLREMINRFRLKTTDSYYGGYDTTDYKYSSSQSGRTISLGEGFDKY